jgi:rod shape-determining protein MreC
MLLSKNRLIRRRAVVGLLLAASLTFLTLSFREGSTGVVGTVQRGAVEATAPFATVAHRVTRPFVDAWNWTTGLVNARDQAAQLERLRRQYGSTLVQVRTLQGENARLRKILNYQGSVKATYPSVTGSVIMQSFSSFEHTITVDVGSSAGVALNDPVVAPAGSGGALVGRVVDVTPGQSQVLLLLDPGSYATAGVQGERNAVGVVKADAGSVGLLSLENIPTAVHVAKGDTVVTAGFGGDNLPSYFPAGIPIGLVSSVSGNDTLSSDKVIQVTPFADFQNLTDVLVLETHR